MKQAIQIKYATEKGTLFSTYQEALIADTLQKQDNVYLDEYKIEQLVKCLADKFTVRERTDNETLGPSDSSQQDPS